MPKVLSDEQVRAFADNGFVSPVVAISLEEAADCRRQLEGYEAETGRSAVETIHIKGHLYFDWAWRLARHPRLIGAISDLVGPDLFIMASRFWIKDPQDRKFVSWHQDHAYFGLKPPTIITAWLALNEVTRHNGCMRAIPGSHRSGTHKHVETHDKDNLLSRGQALVDVDESTAVDLVLKPGEFSIHHGHLFHSSEPNTSDDRRIGFAMMFIPTHVESTIGRRAATLVSGEDRYGYWDHDPLPTRDRDPVIWELMHAADRHYRDNTHRQDAEATQLRAQIDKGLRELDAGLGEELDIESFIRRAREEEAREA
ncbi:MAG: phytanoyl-CoA dioxygenase family protein [Xanthobacteraceae bacterium]|nr:phytanoyl-CoA dioxygenase family protein [Xanthobacteraceae bacterium]